MLLDDVRLRGKGCPECKSTRMTNATWAMQAAMEALPPAHEDSHSAKLLNSSRRIEANADADPDSTEKGWEPRESKKARKKRERGELRKIEPERKANSLEKWLDRRSLKA